MPPRTSTPHHRPPSSTILQLLKQTKRTDCHFNRMEDRPPSSTRQRPLVANPPNLTLSPPDTPRVALGAPLPSETTELTDNSLHPPPSPKWPSFYPTLPSPSAALPFIPQLGHTAEPPMPSNMQDGLYGQIPKPVLSNMRRPRTLVSSVRAMARRAGRRFVCDVCTQSFTSEDHFRRHKRTHYAVEPSLRPIDFEVRAPSSFPSPAS